MSPRWFHIEAQTSSWRFAINELPLYSMASHLKGREDFDYWGDVGFISRGFVDNVAELPVIGVDSQLGMKNQVSGENEMGNTANGFIGDLNDFAQRNIPMNQFPRTAENSIDPFTFITVFRYPESTRSLNGQFFKSGDPNGADGGHRLTFTSAGNVEIRIRRNSSIIKTYNNVLTGDGLHMLAWTYDGSLTLDGMKLYLGDMSTPLTPSSQSGSTITAGDYLNRVDYWQSISGGYTELHGFEHWSAQSAFSPAQLQIAKEILSQVYNL